MPLVASAMAQAVKDALAGVEDTSGAEKLGETVFKYLKDNAVIQYTWVAQMPAPPGPPVPDPVVMFMGTLADPLAPFVFPTPGLNAAPAAMGALSGALNAYLSTCLINNDVGIQTTPLNLISAGVLAPSGLDNQDGALEMMCTQIIAGLSVTPGGAGTHGSFTGAASGGMIM